MLFPSRYLSKALRARHDTAGTPVFRAGQRSETRSYARWKYIITIIIIIIIVIFHFSGRPASHVDGVEDDRVQYATAARVGNRRCLCNVCQRCLPSACLLRVIGNVFQVPLYGEPMRTHDNVYQQPPVMRHWFVAIFSLHSPPLPCRRPEEKKPYRTPPSPRHRNRRSVQSLCRTLVVVFSRQPPPRHSASSSSSSSSVIRQNVSVSPKTRTPRKITGQTPKRRGFCGAVWRLIGRFSPLNKCPDLGPRSIINGQPDFAFNRLR